MSTDLQPPASGDRSEHGATATEAVRVAARAFERDRYLAALLAPASVRDDLVALAAFAGELARIPALVTEPMLGEIRLQWWRDTIEAGLAPGAGRCGHPVGDALLAGLRRRGIAPEAAHALIEAQAARLDDRPFADVAALEANLAAWDGGLFALAWRLGGGTGEPPAVLATAGQAYGLARLLLEAPAELAQGRVLLPRASLAAHGLATGTATEVGAPSLPPEAFIIGADAGPPGAPGRQQMRQWRAVVADLATRAERRLDEAIPRYTAAGRQVRLAALPLALVRPYLKVSRRVDVTGLQAEDVAPLTRVWRLLRVSLTSRP